MPRRLLISSDSRSRCRHPPRRRSDDHLARRAAGRRALAAAAAPPARFNLVGLHWRGRGLGAVPDALDERPLESLAGGGARGGGPARRGHRRACPLERLAARQSLVGRSSDRIEYRLRGRVTRLRAWFVWSPDAGVPARTLLKAGAPAIVPRKGWNADEKIRRAGPSFAATLRLAVVHHTAGANGYTAAQAPAIVRAIQLYHVKGNGWNDIGYNFLVDRFGTVYEGRYGGGIERNVVGAHAEGFNTGSVGVGVLGEYSSLAVAAKARESLAALLAWRLDVAHVDPATTQSFISGGNARFAAGLPVFLRTVSGHRDTGFTDCPGRRSTTCSPPRRRGLPARPAEALRAHGHRRRSRHGPVSARPSAALPWTVDVLRRAGNAVASFKPGPTSTGRGTRRRCCPGATRTRSAPAATSRPPRRHRRRRHLARNRRARRRPGDGLAERGRDRRQHDRSRTR